MFKYSFQFINSYIVIKSSKELYGSLIKDIYSIVTFTPKFLIKDLVSRENSKSINKEVNRLLNHYISKLHSLNLIIEDQPLNEELYNSLSMSYYIKPFILDELVELMSINSYDRLSLKYANYLYISAKYNKPIEIDFNQSYLNPGYYLFYEQNQTTYLTKNNINNKEPNPNIKFTEIKEFYNDDNNKTKNLTIIKGYSFLMLAKEIKRILYK